MSRKKIDDPYGEIPRLGMELKKARQAMQFSQRQLAKVTGIAYPTICNIERGKCDARISTLMRLGRSSGMHFYLRFEE